MEFKKNGKSIVLQKKDYECDEIFLKKGWFLISQPDIIKNYDENTRLSNIWVNKKFKSCIYNKNLMEKLTDMEKNMEFEGY